MISGNGEGRAKGSWSAEEDAELRRLVEKQGAHNWSEIASGIPGRSGKSCRLRWCNQLSPDVHHQPFTSEEDEVIVREHAVHGKQVGGDRPPPPRPHRQRRQKSLKFQAPATQAPPDLTRRDVRVRTRIDGVRFVMNCEIGEGGSGATRVLGPEGLETVLSLMPPGGSLAEERFGAVRNRKGGSVDQFNHNLDRPLGKEEEENLKRNLQRIIANEVKKYIDELI